MANKKQVEIKAEEVKAEMPVIEEKTTATKEPASKIQGLKVKVYDLEGKEVESMTLPTEIFGVEVNEKLLAQAVRVHLSNARQGTVSTKTRGEVDGSTRKIYRQKGTGRARHGGIRAPIFVHGGIVFGPKPRDYSATLPKKMKKAALFAALSAKVQDGGLKIVAGLEKVEAKTKNFATVIEKLGLNNKNKKILVITNGDIAVIKRAGRNITGINITAATRLNAYDVLNNKNLILMKDSVEELKKHFLKGDK
jgi:large subunit ribosomal protein L4